jgi:hypothetical protein
VGLGAAAGDREREDADRAGNSRSGSPTTHRG